MAAGTFVWSLAGAAVVLLLCIFIPRWFCGYACPLGTIIDLFDWSIGRRINRFRLNKRGWWVNLRYYTMIIILAAAAFGILLSGFVAAIAVVTRGMMFIFAPLQLGLLKGWNSVPSMNVGQYISITLFLGLLCLGLLGPRFWCNYVCPTGAVISLASVLRLRQRKVESTCIECGRCISICPFDAIKKDYSTRSINCATCRSCRGVCPKQSIKFVSRWNNVNLKPQTQEPAVRLSTSRRRFLFGSIAAIGGGTAAGKGLLLERAKHTESYPVRPPGSLPEDRFRSQCVRCGQCLKSCTGNILQPAGLGLGIDALWTPRAITDRSGCMPLCNNCGRACPTGAIRELPLEEKRAARMGLAQVNKNTCLPYAQQGDCGLCVNECAAAGYNAIEFIRIESQMGGGDAPVEDSGYLAPVVIEEKCVGCGLCQARCQAANVKDKKLLDESAIKVSAGPGKEDRIATGSYIVLRNERLERIKQQQPKAPQNSYLPDFLQ